MNAKYKYLIIICCSVMLWGCNLIGDIDSIEQKNVLTDETQIPDKASARFALNGVYASWRTMGIGWFVSYLTTLTQAQLPPNLNGIEGFATNEVTIDNPGVRNNYMELYNIINNANTLLANLEKATIPDLPQEEKDEIVAQARFHRACAHFHLLRQYGEFFDVNSKYGIVISDKPERDNTPQQRATVADSYDFIIADLEYAIENCPNEFVENFRVSSTTAKALLSKVYLSKADFTNAAMYAIEVIEEAPDAGYMLEDYYYLDIFENSFNSFEVLFAPHIVQITNLGMMGYDAIELGPTLIRIADELVPGEGDLFTGEGFDPRFAMTYPTMMFEEGEFIQVIEKYPMLDYIAGKPDHTYFMLRLGEIYLIAAEAEFRREGGNKTRARSFLQTICNRASIADFPRPSYGRNYARNISDDDFLETLLKHKYIELSHENGEEWYDLVRYKIVDNMQIAPDYVASDRHLVFPIPQSARAGNPLLEQNPGYPGAN
ncbi:MAG: RagB/SusD family nutrient uptake outer membrane protein [Bacteroidia bacterium]|nr:RagB/SusD family nutrient uptake outer membrane protein [Bacteroidia bacterium]